VFKKLLKAMFTVVSEKKKSSQFSKLKGNLN
jgi:hypothetical protein